METDLMNVRRWLFEDFQARMAPLVGHLLEANPGWDAVALMATVEAMEAPVPLGPDRKAYLLDQYLVARWAPDLPAPPARLPRSSQRVSRRRRVPISA